MSDGTQMAVGVDDGNAGHLIFIRLVAMMIAVMLLLAWRSRPAALVKQIRRGCAMWRMSNAQALISVAAVVVVVALLELLACWSAAALVEGSRL
jgi:uncharacterized membrane protein YidH (DUF202 family)